MALARTTRCCVVTLLALSSLTLRAQAPAPTALALFPLRGLWDLPLDGVLAVPPAFDGSSGYFALDDGRLIAYELTQGVPLWTARVTPQSRPAIGGGLLFMAENSGITALDAGSGAVRWHVPLTDPLSTPLVWDNGWLLASTAAGSVLAFRARDGQLIWHRELPAVTAGPVALASDRVYVSANDSQVYALKVDTGQIVWQRKIGGVPGGLIASDDRVYVGSTDNYLYCLLAKDGGVDWRWPTGADIVGAPVLADGRVYFASLDNLLRALDARNGAQRWKRVLTIRPTRGPVAAGTTIIMSGNAATSPAFDMRTGAPAGDITAAGLAYAAPHFVANNGLPFVVFAARDLAKGTIVKALIRSIDPPATPIGPLPNPIMPATPGTTLEAPVPTSTAPRPPAPR